MCYYCFDALFTLSYVKRGPAVPVVEGVGLQLLTC